MRPYYLTQHGDTGRNTLPKQLNKCLQTCLLRSGKAGIVASIKPKGTELHNVVGQVTVRLG